MFVVLGGPSWSTTDCITLAPHPATGDDTHMPGAASNTSGEIHCRNCGYDLRAQTAPHRCPECGRTFDPANPKTFCLRAPRGAVWRWAKRAAFVFLSIALLAATGWAWLYWGWKSEQTAMAKMYSAGSVQYALGGEEFKRMFGSAAWVLYRAKCITLEPAAPNTDASLVHIKHLRSLEMLDLEATNVTDAGLAHLQEVAHLRALSLDSTQITDAGLLRVKELKGIHTLTLAETQVTDVGLVYLKELPKLHTLDLRLTAVTDAGLPNLAAIKTLQNVDLRGTKVTAEGVAQLQAALPGAKIRWP